VATGWFSSLGWWDQYAAYDAFDIYRAEPTRSHLDIAIQLALPIIRVVYSTQKFKITYSGDEDDFISHAAYTITKAIPKMSQKPREKLDNDKKYMRYLFTCVVNAFYREYDILHGKHNKLQRRVTEYRPNLQPSSRGEKTHQSLEAELTLRRLPGQLFIIAVDAIRFEGKPKRICEYILGQMIHDREIAKSVLQLMGCKDRLFYEQYCNSVLFHAFLTLRQHKPQYDEEMEQDIQEEFLNEVEDFLPEEGYDALFAAEEESEVA